MDAPDTRIDVAAALHSRDITKEEMDEIILQFSAYYGFAKGRHFRTPLTPEPLRCQMSISTSGVRELSRPPGR